MKKNIKTSNKHNPKAEPMLSFIEKITAKEHRVTTFALPGTCL